MTRTQLITDTLDKTKIAALKKAGWLQQQDVFAMLPLGLSESSSSTPHYAQRLKDLGLLCMSFDISDANDGSRMSRWFYKPSVAAITKQYAAELAGSKRRRILDASSPAITMVSKEQAEQMVNEAVRRALEARDHAVVFDSAPDNNKPPVDPAVQVRPDGQSENNG